MAFNQIILIVSIAILFQIECIHSQKTPISRGGNTSITGGKFNIESNRLGGAQGDPIVDYVNRMHKLHKKQLSDEFRKKYCAENNIKLSDFLTTKLNLDKYKLHIDDIKVLKTLSRKVIVEKSDPLEVAASIIATKSYYDSWKRIFKATYDATPEEYLLDLNDIEL